VEETMQTELRRAICFFGLLGGLLTGCAHENSVKMDYQMGEKIPFGAVTYNVLDSGWRTQLGDQFNVRVPQQRFLMVTLSVTNSSGSDVSVPLFQLENSNGQAFHESEDGQGVDNWFGLLRTISPAQTQQGKIVFDVPLSSYKLRLTNGAGPGAEKYTWVEIPLRMDVDSDITPATLGSSGDGK
jgi:hypothetical protein